MELERACAIDLYFTYSYSTQQCECTLTNAYGPFCNQTVTANCPDPNARPSLGRLGDGKCYCLSPHFSFNNQSQTCQCSNPQAYGLACDQMCPSTCIDSEARCDGGRIDSTGICTCIQPFLVVTTATPQQRYVTALKDKQDHLVNCNVPIVQLWTFTPIVQMEEIYRV